MSAALLNYPLAVLGQVTTITPKNQPGMVDFVMQSDAVGKTLLIVLLLMAVTTWYLIFVKGIGNLIRRRRTDKFLRKFWGFKKLSLAEKDLEVNGARESFSRLTKQALDANKHHSFVENEEDELKECKGDADGYLTRAMRKTIDEETARLEYGLTMLGSIGSTAPFVGLFGTVWGVYHALLNIGMTEGVTINQVAAPVGEALIMTGLGLAVAIPAVLALNAFVRQNRLTLSKLDAFAYDLYTFLVTGRKLNSKRAQIQLSHREKGE